MLFLQTLDPESLGLRRTELPLTANRCGCSARLRCLVGATALHLTVSEEDTVRLRAEVPADGGETVRVDLELQDERVAISSPGRHVLTLPPDGLYAPVPPFRIPTAEVPLDLALVVDGSARRASGGGPLLADAAWTAHVEQLVAFVDRLRQASPDVRLAVVAFADDPPPRARASDLLPKYRLYPAASERRLRALSAAELGDELRSIPPSSGGDFVDAVADALAACRELRWRPEARKLLLLAGDSPGHAITCPAPQGGDVQVRELDIDEQASSLHQAGVELVTLYFEMEKEPALELEIERQLRAFARGQYRRLASRPELAFTTSTFHPETAAEIVLAQQGMLARDSTWGELIELLAAKDLS